MASLQRAGPANDPHVVLHHWTGMAIMGIGVVLMARWRQRRRRGGGSLPGSPAPVRSSTASHRSCSRRIQAAPSRTRVPRVRSGGRSPSCGGSRSSRSRNVERGQRDGGSIDTEADRHPPRGAMARGTRDGGRRVHPGAARDAFGEAERRREGPASADHGHLERRRGRSGSEPDSALRLAQEVDDQSERQQEAR
jgi:hypothetical protein